MNSKTLMSISGLLTLLCLAFINTSAWSTQENDGNQNKARSRCVEQLLNQAPDMSDPHGTIDPVSIYRAIRFASGHSDFDGPKTEEILGLYFMAAGPRQDQHLEHEIAMTNAFPVPPTDTLALRRIVTHPELIDQLLQAWEKDHLRGMEDEKKFRYRQTQARWMETALRKYGAHGASTYSPNPSLEVLRADLSDLGVILDEHQYAKIQEIAKRVQVYSPKIGKPVDIARGTLDKETLSLALSLGEGRGFDWSIEYLSDLYQVAYAIKANETHGSIAVFGQFRDYRDRDQLLAILRTGIARLIK